MVTAMTALLFAQDWTAAGHDGADRIATVARVAEAAFAVFMLFLIVRAALVDRRYRASGVLDDAELESLHAALVAAERRTIGEIVPVVVEHADDHPQAPWRAAVLFALAGTGAFAAEASWDGIAPLVLCQLGSGLLGFVLACVLRDFRRWFVADARATEMAEEQAVIEFRRLELERTDGRSGVLLFVALFERRVIVLADEGIATRVDAGVWNSACDKVLAKIRAGALAEGLAEGIAEVGRVLALHFPSADGGRDEIPDRIVIRER